MLISNRIILLPLSFILGTRTVWRNKITFGLSIVALLVCSGCGRKTDNSPQQKPSTQRETVSNATKFHDGHARMLDLLKNHADLVSHEHPIMSDRDTRGLRQELNAATARGPMLPNTLQLHAQLGYLQLRRDKIDEAIEHLTTVQNGLEKLNQEQSIPPIMSLEAAYILAIAHMRRGETRNCCRRNSPESCLLPIKGKGVHTDQEDSKQAIKYFMQVLENAQSDSVYFLKAKWLLNIMYMTIAGYPDDVPKKHLIQPSVFKSDEPFPKFVNIASKLGLNTFGLAGGAIVDDFTGDGYLDIVVSSLDLNEQMRFFRNNRNGTFTDHTEEANLIGLVGGLNMVHADYDNDGDLDILVLRGAWSAMVENGTVPNSLLRNNGDGQFTDVTFAAGLGGAHYPTQTAAWADYDNDGNLDVYIGNEAGDVKAPCQLFRNNGNGTFTDRAREAGVMNLSFTKGVTWGDYNDDGFPDLYVSNLRKDNRLFRNDGDGTFTDIAPQAGVTGPKESFPVWFWDFDNDGALDLYVSNYGEGRESLAAVVANRLGQATDYEPAHLYQGNGKGGFKEVAKAQNLTQLTLPMGVNFGDLDNDGYLDFYLGTGYPDYEALMPNIMYRNQGGTGFSDVTSAGGFGHLQKGHGIAFADLDNDGDQDVFEQMGGFFLGDKYYNALFENPGFNNHWISVKLVGVRSNRSALGARIHIKATENGKQRSIYKHVNSGGSFGSNPLRQTIGLGKAQKIDILEVYWPTTKQTQTFRDLTVDQFIQITEGKEKYEPFKLKKLTLGSP